jgi:hypothetical protein
MLDVDIKIFLYPKKRAEIFFCRGGTRLAKGRPTGHPSEEVKRRS